LDSKQIVEAFKILAKEKNIEKENLSSIIEELFTSLLMKKYGEENIDNFSVIINMDKGDVEIYHEKTVVETVIDELTEISLSDAKKIDKTLELDELCIEVVDPSIFGRRLINTAKQHLSQKIKDIEKQSIYEKFITKSKEIYTGYVHQIQRDRIFIVDEDKIELILPKSEQIPSDRFRRGEQVRGIIKSVDYTIRGPEIILSRSDNEFLERLFELEVPEIEDGIIEVKKISRVPGDRSKIVVYSSDRRIDAVGACVGMKGSRIQSIVRELNGEKIDIINWSDQPEILISRALSPAKPIDLYIDEEKSYALAVFDDDEINRAIGKEGANIRLTKSVTEFNIDVIKKSDYLKNKAVKINDLTTLTDKHKNILIDNGLDDTKQFLDTSKEDLLKFKGLGEKTLEKINDLIIEEIS
tara:strand:- start:8129 stop:9364 length:1236 start_codon:yes stop_codon:yes gene_type:complete